MRVALALAVVVTAALTAAGAAQARHVIDLPDAPPRWTPILGDRACLPGAPDPTVTVYTGPACWQGHDNGDPFCWYEAWDNSAQPEVAPYVGICIASVGRA